ncbi:MAG TPA: glucans biosynthesis glucosyltransferase MdoH [Candidatus Didemnitutus sp.]|nr:glucans biosynthesis glucosyltransferase MdoH [Candidatus Didemnitutus sp.]
MSTIFTVEQVSRARASRRRAFFFTLVFLITSMATWFMADLLWRVPVTPVSVLVLVLFVILFSQVATGFCTAMIGLFVLNRGDRFRISRSAEEEDLADLPLGSTAIVMPVFNEDASRVFEGLRVMYRSIEQTGRLPDFDFFILSDSNDPNRWIQEEVAWAELCKQLGGFGRIFYRKRGLSINKKSGNVADFLRRWGQSYRYMIVLDADSIMTGDSMVRLVAMMERNPHVGILQTAPRIVNGVTLYSRLQQFANRLYSPLFLAGLNFWHLGESNFWGHNAVIRVAPFMEHASLPELPGIEPFGGRILSHDFVEAALMRRAGWSVWLAYDLEGSYEEGPPTLIDSAKRDRRWCQGNLQHSWLLFARGFHPLNRFHLLMGIMAYVSSPLWLLFMLISTLQRFHEVTSGAAGRYHAENYTLIFGYPVEIPEAMALFGFTLILLFLPKVLSVLVALRERRGIAFGGPFRLIVSALLEMLLSALLAPINMMFHAKFVVYILLGQGVSWSTQQRAASDDADWHDAVMNHLTQSLFAIVWGASAYVLVPSFFWWLSPILLGLLVAAPLSIFLGRARFGRRARDHGLFLTPDETQPAPELPLLERHLAECYRHMQPIPELREDYGMLQAVLDPYVNAVHVALLRQRKRSLSVRRYFMELRRRLLAEGPENLSAREKMALLRDAESMNWLHEQLWKQPSEQLSDWWQLAMRQYNVLTTTPVTALYR